MGLGSSPNVTTISKSGSTALGGAITLSAGAGASLTQSGQDIQIGSAPSIGGTITSGTAGSVLFVATGPVIQEDNTNFFWDDANNRLGIGTNSPGAHLEIMSLAAANIGLIVQGAASQSGDFYQIQDSSGNNLIRTSMGGQYATTFYFASNQTITGNIVGFDSQTTITSSSAVIAYFRGLNTIVYTNSPGFGFGPIFFSFQATIKATTNGLTMTQPVGFSYTPSLIADGIAWTSFENSAIASFVDSPTFSIANSGSFVTYTHNGLKSSLTISSGTIDQRNSISIVNATGAGAVTTQVGIKIADLTKGTTNISLQVLGTTSQNRLVPKTKFGADSAPSVDVDVNGAAAFGKSTVSLTADNQAIVTANISYISLSSNNATASNRDFVLNQSTVAGQILVLEWTGTNAGQMIDDVAQGGGGNTRLSANWVPTQYDTLTLISNGTDWIEIARSTN